MELSLKFAAAIIAAYLLGSLNFSIIISRAFFKKDIRNFGSGNAGSTNAYRMMGGWITLIVMLGDFLKGVAAVLFAGLLLQDLGNVEIIGKLLAGIAVVLGHSLPLYFGFKGGKGVLTSAAVLIMIDSRLLLIVLSVFLIIALLSRYISLASICAAVSLPISIVILYGFDLTYLFFGIMVSAFVIYLHRSNIKRLYHGKENQFSFKRASNSK